MPIDPSIIVAGANVLGQAANAASQGNMNRKSREYADKSWFRQQAANFHNWNQQNEYNSPKAQMARLQEAGLNPNLIYGSGQAQQAASPISAASTPTWSPRAPQVEIAPAIASHFDVRLKQAQYDNLKAQNTVLTNEALLKIAQIANLNTGTTGKGIQNSLAAATYGNTLEASNESLRSMQMANYRSSIDNQWHESNASSKSDLLRGQAEKIWQEINESKSRMQSMTQDQKLKQFEINLRKNGLNPNDPMIMRMIGQIIANKFNLNNLIK